MEEQDRLGGVGGLPFRRGRRVTDDWLRLTVTSLEAAVRAELLRHTVAYRESDSEPIRLWVLRRSSSSQGRRSTGTGDSAVPICVEGRGRALGEACWVERVCGGVCGGVCVGVRGGVCECVRPGRGFASGLGAPSLNFFASLRGSEPVLLPGLEGGVEGLCGGSELLSPLCSSFSLLTPNISFFWWPGRTQGVKERNEETKDKLRL